MHERDQWNSLSDFLSNMIIKYADVIDIDPLSTSDSDISSDKPKNSKVYNIQEDVAIKENI